MFNGLGLGIYFFGGFDLNHQPRNQSDVFSISTMHSILRFKPFIKPVFHTLPRNIDIIPCQLSQVQAKYL